MQENGQREDKPTELLSDKHVSYVVNHGNDKNDFVSFAKNHLVIRKLKLINFN